MYTLATQKLDQVSDDVLQRTTVSKRAANVVMRETQFVNAYRSLPNNSVDTHD